MEDKEILDWINSHNVYFENYDHVFLQYTIKDKNNTHHYQVWGKSIRDCVEKANGG